MKHNIAVIRGDGIGPEIISEGEKVLDAVSELENFELEWVEYPHGAEHYLSTGELLNEDTLKLIHTLHRSSSSKSYTVR